METVVKDRKARDFAAQRYTETLFAGGEAIAYHAEASAAAAGADISIEGAWKAESAKHKAVAAALQAVAAAHMTIDAAMDVTHSSIGKGWRNELKVAETKILAAASRGAMNEEKKPVDVADAARDVIDVARRAAEAAARYVAAHPVETDPAF